MNRVKITVFADPVCTWCWGSVPVTRALAYNYGDKLEFSYVMGGMIEDIATFSNRRLSIGGDVEMSNRNIHKHWIDASAVHGMPVCESGFHLFSAERCSTIPQNYAYIAAELYMRKNPYAHPVDAHLHFLRHLQEATAVDAALTNEVDVIAGIAATVGFDTEKYLEIYNGADVKQLYKEGKALCGKYEVQAFPTYLLEYRGEEMMLRGYSAYSIICHSIDHLTYENIKPVTDGRQQLTAENVRKFISQYGNAYPIEIATAFGIKRRSGHVALNVESYEGLPDVVDELLEAGEIAMAPKGNGFFYYCLKEGETPLQRRSRHLAGAL